MHVPRALHHPCAAHIPCVHRAPPPAPQPANKFGFDNKCMSKAFAMDVSRGGVGGGPACVALQGPPAVQRSLTNDFPLCVASLGGGMCPRARRPAPPLPHPPLPPPPQVIEETHSFYNRLRSGKRANTEELSLV